MALSKLELAVDTGKWDAGIKKAQTALRNFANSQGGVQQALQKSSDKTMKFVKMMGDMQSKADTSKGKANDYKRAIEQLSAATEHMNSAQKKVADDAIAKLTKRFQEAKTQADSLSKSLKQIETPNTGGLGGMLGGFDAKSMATSLVGFGTAAGAAMMAVNGLKEAIAGNIRTAMDFEQANANLASVLGTTRDNITMLTEDAKQLGATTQFTASEVTSLQTELAKLGFSQDEIKNSTAGILNFSAATGTDLASAAKLAGASLRAFNLDAKEMDRVVSTMAVATTKSALDFEYLNSAMSTIAPVANQFGFSIEDVSALLGTLANSGFDASSAATATRNILLMLADSSSKLSTELGRPVTSLDDLSEALQELQARGVDLGEMFELTDKRSVAAFATFVQGSDKLIELRNSVTDCNDALKTMVDERMDTMEGSLKKLSSAWEGLNLAINSDNGIVRDATDLLTESIGVLTDCVNWVNELKAKTDEAGSAAAISWDIYKESLKSQLPVWVKLISKVHDYWKAVRGEDGGAESEEEGWKGDKPTIAKPGEVNDVSEQAKKQLTQTKPGKGTGGSGGGGDKRFDTFKLQLQQFKAEIADPGFGGGIDGGALWKMLGGDISIKKLQDMKSVLQQQFDTATSEQDRLKLKADIELTEGWIEALKAPGEWTIDENGVRIPLKMEIDHDALMKSAEEFNKNIQEQTNQKPSTIGAGYSKGLGMANKAYGGVKEIVGGLESLGIEFGKGFKDFMSKLDGVMSILNGINTIISVINSVRDTAYQSTMIGLTTTIAAAAVIEAANPFARGGIVAAGGAMVPGSSLSGDLVPARINSGEMILNKQEQRNLFEQLRDGQPVNGTSVAMGSTRVQGRDLLLAINNELRATGRRTL